MAITLDGTTGITLPASGDIINASMIQSDTSNPPTFQNTSGTEIGTLCRAWVNFNGTGVVSIRASFNVSSITDGGAGTYSVNLTNPMPNANYIFVSIGEFVGGSSSTSSPGVVSKDNGITPTVSNFGIMSVTKDNSTRIDNPFICVAVFA